MCLEMRNEDAIESKAWVVNDRFANHLRFLNDPWVQILVLAHEIHDGNDVVMGIGTNHRISCRYERVWAAEGIVDICVDVGFVFDGKTFVGGEDAFEEGEEGWHVGSLFGSSGWLILCCGELQFFIAIGSSCTPEMG